MPSDSFEDFDNILSQPVGSELNQQMQNTLRSVASRYMGLCLVAESEPIHPALGGIKFLIVEQEQPDTKTGQLYQNTLIISSAALGRRIERGLVLGEKLAARAVRFAVEFGEILEVGNLKIIRPELGPAKNLADVMEPFKRPSEGSVISLKAPFSGRVTLNGMDVDMVMELESLNSPEPGTNIFDTISGVAKQITEGQISVI